MSEWLPPFRRRPSLAQVISGGAPARSQSGTPSFRGESWRRAAERAKEPPREPDR